MQPRNPDLIGAREWLLAPWSLNAIAMNTGLPQDAIRSFASSKKSLALSDETVSGISIEMLRKLRNDENMETKRTLEAKFRNDVSGYMNQHLLNYILTVVDQLDRPVRLEDALFDMKNGIMLPDDFIPEYLMGNIEGEISPDPKDVLREIQSSAYFTDIYCYFEVSNEHNGSLAFIYPSRSTPRPPSGNEEIRKKISDSFTKLQSTPEFRDFELSRTLKTVIYNLEKRNTRELGRPSFDQKRVALLESESLVERRDEKTVIKDSVDLKTLISLQRGFKLAAKQLAEDWLSREI